MDVFACGLIHNIVVNAFLITIVYFMFTRFKSIKALRLLKLIELQLVTSSAPRLRQSYLLQLLSATNGAILKLGNESQSTIIVVASGNPRGVFEFSGSPYVNVSRLQNTVS